MTEYVRVPKEPTEAMRDAANSAVMAFAGSGLCIDDMTRLVWSTMLAASPQGEGSSAEAEPVPRYELHPTGSGGSSDVLTYRVTEGVKL